MSDKTIERIDRIVQRIGDHPEYSSKVCRDTALALQEEAARHSIGLELIGETSGRKESEGIQREALERIKNAWSFLCKHGLEMWVLAKLGSVIEPDNNKSTYFRNELVQFGPFYGHEPGMIASSVDNLRYLLGNEDRHPVKKAIEAHLDLVRIHPYMDGNGRVSRLVQNFSLQQDGYPAAVIPSSDRELYIRLLEDTLKDRNRYESSIDYPSRVENLFHEYIASKVLRSAERLEGELRERRMYNVIMGKIPNRGVVGSVAKMIRNHSKAQGKPVSVKTDRSTDSKRGANLYVVGNIGSEEVDAVMGRCQKRYKFDYRVNPVRE